MRIPNLRSLFMLSWIFPHLVRDRIPLSTIIPSSGDRNTSELRSCPAKSFSLQCNCTCTGSVFFYFSFMNLEVLLLVKLGSITPMDLSYIGYQGIRYSIVRIYPQLTGKALSTINCKHAHGLYYSLLQVRR